MKEEASGCNFYVTKKKMRSAWGYPTKRYHFWHLGIYFFQLESRSEVAISVVFYCMLVNAGLPLTTKKTEPW